MKILGPLTVLTLVGTLVAALVTQAAMERRLGSTPQRELETALDEVEKIARIRIDALIDG